MYLSTNRFWLHISKSMRGLLWLSLGVGLALSSRLAVGQDAPAGGGGQSDIGDAVEDGVLFGDRYTGRSGEAFGALIRGGVSTGPAVGRETSIFPVEFMPYAFADKAMFFTDFRGFRATTDNWGGSLGTGVRYHSDQLDRIFGANAFYDYDNSSGALFRDVGFGLETLGKLWDMRANAYFPQGVTERLLSTTFVQKSQAFVGNQITYSQARLIGNALTGVDMEVGIPLPGRVMQRHEVRAAGGWYYYKGVEVPGFAGWKTRLQANVLPSVQMQVEVTSDQIFHTNVIFGATWTYGGFRQPDGEVRTQFSRMTDPIRRNYNVVVGRTTVIDKGIVAVNPLTALPYFVEHVASYATGPAFNGTVLDPFKTVVDAQANAKSDIIFVHADSVFNNTGVDLKEASVRILGEGNGVEHRINVAALGAIPVPRATAFVNRPLYLTAPGDGVTLTSSGVSATQPTEFSGFQIGSADPLLGPASGAVGNGIFGNAVGNFKITQTDINFSKGDGVLLQNLTGPVTMLGVHINDPVANATALHVSGGVGGVTFGNEPFSGKQGTIVNSGGRALWIENRSVGSFVDLTGSKITDTAGQGILIDNSLSNAGGKVTIDTAIITQGTSSGIEIIGGSGSTNFIGPVTIDRSAGDAINIHDTLVANSVSFGTLAVAGVANPTAVTITNRNGRGINLLNNAGNVSFFGPVSITDTVLPLGSPAAIEFQASSGTVRFQTLALDGGLNDGILIGNNAVPHNTGQFLVAGATTITNFAGNGLTVTNDDSTVQFNGLNVSNRGLSGVNVNNNRGTLVFRGITTIGNLNLVTNLPFSSSPAVDFQNNTAGGATFETLSITDATRPLPLIGGAGLNVLNNPATVSVGTLNIASVDGIGLFVNNAGTNAVGTPVGTPITGGVNTTTGTIITSGTRPAIEVRNSVIQLGFQSVSSANSLSEGIALTNNIGRSAGNLFTVTGLSGALTTGGTITGAGTAPPNAADTNNGLLFVNTGGVSLAGMTIQGSVGAGINASTNAILPVGTAITNLSVINSAITANGGVGVIGLNTPIVTLLGNTIRNNNGLNEVQLIAATNTNYSFAIGSPFTADGNTITHASGNLVIENAVSISTQGAGTGANLGLTFINNTVSTTGLFDTGLRVDWNGPVNGTLGNSRFGAEIDTNIFNTVGANPVIIPVPPPTAIRFNLPSATAISNVNILSNTVVSTGTGNVGFDVTTGGGASNIVVGRLLGQLRGNTMTFNGNGDIAVQATLGANTTATVSDNTIAMTGSQSEALRFPLVQGPSSLFIERNIISINGIPGLTDRGINILAATGQVTLFGNGGIDGNDIRINGFRGAGIPYFAAPANILGNIFVNGVRQP